MKEKTLFQLVNEVEDEDTFIGFIEELQKDRNNNRAADEWKNNTIEDFLECSHAWAISSKNGLEFYDKPTNPWKRCAQILYMGKIYE